VLAPELALVAASVVVAVVSAPDLAAVLAQDLAAVLVQDLAAVLARELAVVLAPVPAAPEQELAALVSAQARAMAALVLASVSVEAAAAQRIDSPSKPARRCLLRQHATTRRCSPPRPARPWRSHYRFVPIEWQSTAPGLPRSKRSRKASSW